MRAAQIYISPAPAPSADQIGVPNMGLNAPMPPGLVRHGGKGSDFGCLLMIFHGAGQILDRNGRDWLNAKNRFVAWNLEDEHHFGNSASSWNHSWIWLSGRWFSQILRKGLVPTGVPLDIGGDALPLRHMETISNELRSRVEQDPVMLQAMVQVFWHDMERHFSASSAVRRRDPRMDHARNFIEEHFDRPFDLAETAAQAHLSPAHFCHRFAKQFGVPPREFAMRLRMQRAAQLLTYEDLAIFQIAEMVGCPDAHYFSRLFRKRYGLSPHQYRQKERNKPTTPPTVA